MTNFFAVVNAIEMIQNDTDLLIIFQKWDSKRQCAREYTVHFSPTYHKFVFQGMDLHINQGQEWIDSPQEIVNRLIEFGMRSFIVSEWS